MTALACQVSDVTGIDDKSFNETAWAGMERAQAEDSVSPSKFLIESTDATDYRPNIDAFIEQGCDVIITVGLLALERRPPLHGQSERLFAIIDYGVLPAAMRTRHSSTRSRRRNDLERSRFDLRHR